jgi:hypothetical protein
MICRNENPMNRLLLLCCFVMVLAGCKRPAEEAATPRGKPTTYLIAPDGKVAKHFLGPVTANDIDTAIANAGGPKPAA